MAVRTTYFFGSYSSSVKRPFIIQINSGADSSFTIPTTGGGYNYDVRTSDGQTFSGVTGNLTITFPNANTHYDVEITGDFPRIFFNNGSERLKLIDIKLWGDIEWTSMERAFWGCSNTTCTATDSPDMTLVTNGAGMSQNASAFNPTNFSPTLENLTNGASMFLNASAFNPPNFAPTLESLTNGNRMFENASEFAQEIYCPNTTQLTNDSYMFRGTKIAKITLNNTALINTNAQAYNCPLLTDLILIDRKINLDIRFSPLLTGIKIDNLFTSLGTANSGATITITTAQSTSGIDTTIATAKGWTIVIV